MATIRCNLFYSCILSLFLATCSSYDSVREEIQNNEHAATLTGQFMLPQQVAPPAEIQSVALYRGSNEGAPPIINLSGNQQLTLEFDHISPEVRQFKLTVSHRSKNWEESPISPSAYLESFFETYFGDGRKSFVQNPTYYHYTYRFPNERLTITQSGNYFLSVWDYDSSELLFRIPFFVTENKGKLTTQIETLFAQRDDARSVAQPFSEYRYPRFIQQPQFDLSFMYVQNQFWGRRRETKRFDTATPGVVNFHLGRDDAFIADYEFNLLEIPDFDPDGRHIIDVYSGETPPRVILRRDVQRFEGHPASYPSVFKIPHDDRRAQYGSVQFFFEPASALPENAQLYIVGDFNSWMIDRNYRMAFDSADSLWKGDGLIKQGIYHYKYVLLRNNQINDLELDRMFTSSRSQYITFVYFHDPQRNFDRLLQVDITSQ